MMLPGKNNIPKPNFFVVGMARAGTTSLWHYLHKHPDVFMSRLKEPNYFDMDIDYFAPDVDVIKEMKKLGILKPNLRYERRYRSYENYMSLFKKVRKKRIIGECSVSYITSKTACEAIYCFNKNSKILISLRNPVDAIYSLYYLYKNMRLYTDSFDNFIRSETLIDRYLSIPTNITKFQNLFGIEKTKIIFFEDFIRNTKGIYQQILDFLEVDRDILPDFSVFRSSQKIKNYTPIHVIFDNPLLKKIRGTFSLNELGISRNINQYLGGYDQRPSLGEKQRMQLMIVFKTCIDQLQEITKRNLSHWYN